MTISIAIGPDSTSETATCKSNQQKKEEQQKITSLIKGNEKYFP